MNLTDVLWAILISCALLPVIQKKILDAARLKLLREFQEKRGSVAIALIHRQETISFLGFPLVRYIDVNDSEEVLRAIRLCAPDSPIDLIIHTPAGFALAAEKIADALRRHRGKVSVFVPHHAMSGGTLIALVADEIVMDENAVLGPVDTPLGQSLAASILTVLESKEPKDFDDETLSSPDAARKAIARMRERVRGLHERRMKAGRAQAGAEKRSTAAWTHDDPIDVAQARELGWPVKTDVPDEIYDFMSYFPQPIETQPLMEYLPLSTAAARPASAGGQAPKR